MYYDAVGTELMDKKLLIIQGNSSSSSASHVIPDIPVEEEAIEEEKAAAIQTLCKPPKTCTSQMSKSEGSTPLRKISPSSDFKLKTDVLYPTSSSTANSSYGISSFETDENDTNITSGSIYGAGRLPTKGVESKLLSMWHNVKYGWSGKLKSNFSKEQPVWLLGKCYHRKFSPSPSVESIPQLLSSNTLSDTTNPNIIPGSIYPANYPMPEEEPAAPQELAEDAVESEVNDNPWEEGIEGFKRDFYTRIWMTYRREFPILNGSNYTSDCGWGCMLRSGQMLLAQALMCHFLGRSWRYNPENLQNSTYEDNMHRKIIRWFGDSSSKSNPFSIHTLVQLGQKMGKKPGDWYGPASVSFLLRQAFKNASLENADFDNLVLYVAKDCTIYMGDVEAECKIPECTNKMQVPWCKLEALKVMKESCQQWKSIILLIPLRLGSDKLNPIYSHCLKLLLSTEYCIGVIGGRPKHSLYFIGFQENKLIYLDPHYCQEMVDFSQHDFPFSSFHCKSPRKLKVGKMDPSCCIGFYCRTKADLDNFVDSVQMYLRPMGNASGTSTSKVETAQQMLSDANPSFNEAKSQQYAERNYPLFSFSSERYIQPEADIMNDSFCNNKHLKQLNQQDSKEFEENTELDSDTEKFVML